VYICIYTQVYICIHIYSVYTQIHILYIHKYRYICKNTYFFSLNPTEAGAERAAAARGPPAQRRRRTTQPWDRQRPRPRFPRRCSWASEGFRRPSAALLTPQASAGFVFRTSVCPSRTLGQCFVFNSCSAFQMAKTIFPRTWWRGGSPAARSPGPCPQTGRRRGVHQRDPSPNALGAWRRGSSPLRWLSTRERWKPRSFPQSRNPIFWARSQAGALGVTRGAVGLQGAMAGPSRCGRVASDAARGNVAGVAATGWRWPWSERSSPTSLIPWSYTSLQKAGGHQFCLSTASASLARLGELRRAPRAEAGSKGCPAPGLAVPALPRAASSPSAAP